MTMIEQLSYALAANGFGEYEVESEETIVCPEGETIEWDGDCDCHGPSPVKTLGLI